MDALALIATEAVQNRKNELWGKALVSEEKVLLGSDTPLAALNGLLSLYVDTCKELADYCVERYRWVNTHSTSQKTQDVGLWLKRFSPEVEALSEHGVSRFEYHSAPFAQDKLFLSATSQLFDRLFQDVLDRMEHDLKTAHGEFTSAGKRKRLDRLEKAAWLAGGAVLGCVMTVLAKHFTASY